jgi:hypothetical protein
VIFLNLFFNADFTYPNVCFVQKLPEINITIPSTPKIFKSVIFEYTFNLLDMRLLKIIFLLFIFFSFRVNGQQDIEKQAVTEYCKVRFINFVFKDYINMYVTTGSGRYRVNDESGEAVRFINEIEGFNYLAKEGWELVQVYQTPGAHDYFDLRWTFKREIYP